MTVQKNRKPVVLVMAGHDPSGGAGIQADIETIACNGCHAISVITCLTAQNTAEFRKSIQIDPLEFMEQVEMVLADIFINSCKIGLITDTGILSAIEKVLKKLKNVPVVLDPVISAGTGQKIVSKDIHLSMHDKLIPFTSIITPNSLEARELTGLDDLDAAGGELIKRGCKAVLITGAHEHEESKKIINTLYRKNQIIRYEWQRLPGNYHGSGCTLSSGIAARLALGQDLQQAAEAAQEYTWQTLRHAIRYGNNQYHPDRFYRDS
jgi:hydroxymethylpyrimidine/phosphomethylpyrimidine kinase